MKTVASAVICCSALLAATLARADPVYVGPDEHQPASVTIALSRGQMTVWAAKDAEIHAWCFFHAANVAEVDGRWYAINGMAHTGLSHHWIEDGGRRETLHDGDRVPAALRDFLSAVNDKMNDACP